MAYSVVFTPEARAQLIALYRYIEIDASPAIAQRFTDAIVNHFIQAQELEGMEKLEILIIATS